MSPQRVNQTSYWKNRIALVSIEFLFLFALCIQFLHHCNNLNGLKRLTKTFGSSNLKQITINNQNN